MTVRMKADADRGSSCKIRLNAKLKAPRMIDRMITRPAILSISFTSISAETRIEKTKAGVNE
jgi:hypothetical protein